jgi:hypothetical protein
VFDVGPAQVTLVTPPMLEHLLPGERPPALPAFVAAVVRVRDPGITREVLDRSGLPSQTTATGSLFVPASAALGAAIVFQPTAAFQVGQL